MSLRISIREVAEKAGCSIATVSNVLNNKGRVGPQKRKDVLRAVRSLGYAADAAGRNLRLRRTETIGLLFYPSCSHIFRNPFYAEVMEGLEEGLTKAGYHLLLAGHNATHADSDVPTYVTRGKVDGMILLGRFPETVIEKFYGLKVPLLLLDSNIDELPIDSIISDGFSAGSQIIDYLAGLGHRRIVMLAYEMEDYNIDFRIRGFLSGLAAHGLPDAEKAVIRTALSHDTLYAALKRRLTGARAPTAVVTVNDTLAVAILERLNRDGIRVPEDVSVVGYDDDLAATAQPPLSTIYVNKKELGRSGAGIILKRIDTPDAPVAKLRLPVELIKRASVAHPPRS